MATPAERLPLKSPSGTDIVPEKLKEPSMSRGLTTFLVATTIAVVPALAVRAADSQAERGKYLVEVGGCTDCHTPGNLVGHPDMTRYLGGSDVGFAVPGLGVFFGPNLTPDQETGLGTWTAQQIVTAITTGSRPDGRQLAPVMPWQGYAHLTTADALAIASFLQSLPPIHNKVAGPFGPAEKPTGLVMSVQPADVYATLPHPK
jgi:mono/diheme cytochrome c family protein